MYITGIGGKKIKIPYDDGDYSIFGKGKTIYDIAINSHKQSGNGKWKDQDMFNTYIDGLQEGWLKDRVLAFDDNLGTKIGPAANGKGINDLKKNYGPLRDFVNEMKFNDPTLPRRSNELIAGSIFKSTYEYEDVLEGGNIVKKQISSPTSLTLTDKFVIANGPAIIEYEKIAPGESIKHIIDLRTNSFSNEKLNRPEKWDYDIKQFLRPPGFLPKPKTKPITALDGRSVFNMQQADTYLKNIKKPGYINYKIDKPIYTVPFDDNLIVEIDNLNLYHDNKELSDEVEMLQTKLNQLNEQYEPLKRLNDLPSKIRVLTEQKNAELANLKTYNKSGDPLINALDKKIKDNQDELSKLSKKYGMDKDIFDPRKRSAKLNDMSRGIKELQVLFNNKNKELTNFLIKDVQNENDEKEKLKQELLNMNKEIFQLNSDTAEIVNTEQELKLKADNIDDEMKTVHKNTKKILQDYVNDQKELSQIKKEEEEAEKMEKQKTIIEAKNKLLEQEKQLKEKEAKKKAKEDAFDDEFEKSIKQVETEEALHEYYANLLLDKKIKIYGIKKVLAGIKSKNIPKNDIKTLMLQGIAQINTEEKASLLVDFLDKNQNTIKKSNKFGAILKENNIQDDEIVKAIKEKQAEFNIVVLPAPSKVPKKFKK